MLLRQMESLMLVQWPKLVTLGLEATAGEGQWISRENEILVGLSICSHPLPILPDYALRSLWLEGKVSDALLMKTREGCKNKKLIFPVLTAAGGPRPVLQTLTNLFFNPSVHSNIIMVSLCNTFKKVRTHRLRRPPPHSACSSWILLKAFNINDLHMYNTNIFQSDGLHILNTPVSPAPRLRCWTSFQKHLPHSLW